MKASRDFVCVRLLTYESASEAEVLKSIFIGGSGDLENTTFALLSPEGARVSRAHRSPNHMYRDAKELASAMAKIAAKYPAKEASLGRLPYHADLRRAINAASCDIQPLVVVVKDREIESTLAPLAWGREFTGRFAYVFVSDPEDLRVIDGAPKTAGVLVVQPDTYGTSAKLLASDPGISDESLAKALRAGASKFVGETKDSHQHIQEGKRQGIFWKTEIPDTDPGGPPRRP